MLELEPADHELHAADEAETKPGHRPDHDQQAKQRDQRRREPAAVAEPSRQAAERSIERNGEDRAPQRDVQEGPDYLQRPVCEEAKEADTDQSVDGRDVEPGRREILVGFCGHGLRNDPPEPIILPSWRGAPVVPPSTTQVKRDIQRDPAGKNAALAALRVLRHRDNFLTWIKTDIRGSSKC